MHVKSSTFFPVKMVDVLKIGVKGCNSCSVLVGDDFDNQFLT